MQRLYFGQARQLLELLQLNLSKDQYSNSLSLLIWGSNSPRNPELLPLMEFPWLGMGTPGVRSGYIRLYRCTPQSVPVRYDLVLRFLRAESRGATLVLRLRVRSESRVRGALVISGELRASQNDHHQSPSTSSTRSAAPNNCTFRADTGLHWLAPARLYLRY